MGILTIVKLGMGSFAISDCLLCVEISAHEMATMMQKTLGHV